MASTPSIRIDLSSGGQGTTGQSRTDATNGETATLVDTANSSGSYTWTLVTPDGSSSTLSDANAASPTFTIDVAHGSYLVFCEVDGVRSYSENAVGAKVSTQGGVAVLENAFRKPVAGETTQFDSDQGWEKTLDDFLDDLTGLYSPTHGEIAYADSNGEWVTLAPGTSGDVLTTQGAGANPQWQAAAGGVSGPGSSTDNAIARFDGAGGGTLQNSGVLIDDSDNITGVGSITMGGALAIQIAATNASISLDDSAGDTATITARNANSALRLTSPASLVSVDIVGQKITPTGGADLQVGADLDILGNQLIFDTGETMQVSGAGILVQTGGVNVWYFEDSFNRTYKNILPNVDASVALGSGSLHWSSIYVSGSGGEIFFDDDNDTYVTSLVDDELQIVCGSTEIAEFDAAEVTLATDLNIGGNYLEGAEMAEPGAPAATGFRLFAQDNGGGKTQLMVRFASGASQQVAIEP